MSVVQKDMDTYIAGFPKEVRTKLEQMRDTIRSAAPAAIETINYGIPTFKLKGNLVHFAAFRNHIGFYPTPTCIRHFSQELLGYEVPKGTVKFPLDQEIPFKLIGRMVAFRVREVQADKG